jgi:hypothetical protein
MCTRYFSHTTILRYTSSFDDCLSELQLRKVPSVIQPSQGVFELEKR